jgi:hypothetical protein
MKTPLMTENRSIKVLIFKLFEVVKLRMVIVNVWEAVCAVMVEVPLMFSYFGYILNEEVV